MLFKTMAERIAPRCSSQIPSSNSAVADDMKPPIQTSECRICREEDATTNLDIPCACRGTLTYSHIPCLQRWINQKRRHVCEICSQPYNSNFTVPVRTPNEVDIDIGGPNPQALAMIEARRRVLQRDAVIEACCYIFPFLFIMLVAFLLLVYWLPKRKGKKKSIDWALLSMIKGIY